ncbi:hypothetical protein [Auraticoccus monumenti]|uniref:Lipocalin-like domain-containing protein n=1 Tax=Auraticoccus monumenti TaxID=675864 RepID=A0A1G7CSJ4_9ACTN|nr:hypothetical protein [Auraticoccus monumenti]SDE42384.1 hypothetical protein SAMN04489747_3367 [Auraticoccus monumenti]
MRARIGLLLGVAALGAATACTPGQAAGPDPVATAPASSPVTAPAPTDRGTPAATATGTRDGGVVADAELQQALDCLEGSWRMASFAIEADSSVTTEGEGGDVRLEFGDGSWWLHSDDDEAVTVRVGTKEAELTLDGHAEGSVDVTAEGVRFSVQDSDGRVELELPEGMADHGMPLGHFLATIVPTGSTTLECDDDEATVSSGNTMVNQVLTLER